MNWFFVAVLIALLVSANEHCSSNDLKNCLNQMTQAYHQCAVHDSACQCRAVDFANSYCKKECALNENVNFLRAYAADACDVIAATGFESIRFAGDSDLQHRDDPMPFPFPNADINADVLDGTKRDGGLAYEDFVEEKVPERETSLPGSPIPAKPVVDVMLPKDYETIISGPGAKDELGDVPRRRYSFEHTDGPEDATYEVGNRDPFDIPGYHDSIENDDDVDDDMDEEYEPAPPPPPPPPPPPIHEHIDEEREDEEMFDDEYPHRDNYHHDHLPAHEDDEEYHHRNNYHHGRLPSREHEHDYPDADETRLREPYHHRHGHLRHYEEYDEEPYEDVPDGYRSPYDQPRDDYEHEYMHPEPRYREHRPHRHRYRHGGDPYYHDDEEDEDEEDDYDDYEDYDDDEDDDDDEEDESNGARGRIGDLPFRMPDSDYQPSMPDVPQIPYMPMPFPGSAPTEMDADEGPSFKEKFMGSMPGTEGRDDDDSNDDNDEDDDDDEDNDDDYDYEDYDDDGEEEEEDDEDEEDDTGKKPSLKEFIKNKFGWGRDFSAVRKIEPDNVPNETLVVNAQVVNESDSTGPPPNDANKPIPEPEEEEDEYANMDEETRRKKMAEDRENKLISARLKEIREKKAREEKLRSERQKKAAEQRIVEKDKEKLSKSTQSGEVQNQASSLSPASFLNPLAVAPVGIMLLYFHADAGVWAAYITAMGIFCYIAINDQA